MKNLNVFLFTLIFLTHAKALWAHKVTDLRSAISAAEQDQIKNSTYVATLMNEVGPLLGEQMKSCSPPGSSLSSFDLVFHIDAGGKTTKLFLTEGSKTASCVAKKLNKFKFSKPPFSPFYFHIDMHLTR